MSYSDRQMREIEKDPVRLRGYFWRVATNCRQMAAERRNQAQRGFIAEHGDLNPETLEKVADCVLQNIDALVSSTLARS